jgi:hypothetical protein
MVSSFLSLYRPLLYWIGADVLQNTVHRQHLIPCPFLLSRDQAIDHSPSFIASRGLRAVGISAGAACAGNASCCTEAWGVAGEHCSRGIVDWRFVNLLGLGFV